jgi:hypothetical protein
LDFKKFRLIIFWKIVAMYKIKLKQTLLMQLHVRGGALSNNVFEFYFIKDLFLIFIIQSFSLKYYIIIKLINICIIMILFILFLFN